MTLRVRAPSPDETRQLTEMARSRKRGAGLVRRAQIVLHAVDGLSAPEIAPKMDVCGQTVRFWLKRFNAQGVAGLEEGGALRPPTDLLRPGAERGHHRRLDPPPGLGLAVRVLDPGASGGLPE